MWHDNKGRPLSKQHAENVWRMSHYRNGLEFLLWSEGSITSWNVMLRLSLTSMPRSITFSNIINIDLSALSNKINYFPSRDNLWRMNWYPTTISASSTAKYTCTSENKVCFLYPLCSLVHNIAMPVQNQRLSPGTPLCQNWPTRAQRNVS